MCIYIERLKKKRIKKTLSLLFFQISYGNIVLYVIVDFITNFVVKILPSFSGEI